MKGLKQCLLFPKTNCGCALVTLIAFSLSPSAGFSSVQGDECKTVHVFPTGPAVSAAAPLVASVAEPVN
jgi:hypothetical protein